MTMKSRTVTIRHEQSSTNPKVTIFTKHQALCNWHGAWRCLNVVKQYMMEWVSIYCWWFPWLFIVCLEQLSFTVLHHESITSTCVPSCTFCVQCWAPKVHRLYYTNCLVAEGFCFVLASIMVSHSMRRNIVGFFQE